MTQEVIGAVADAASAGTGSLSPSEAAKAMGARRAAFKATAYLYAIGVQVADKTSVPQGAEALGGKAKKPAAGKGAKGGRKAAAEHEEEEEAGEGGAREEEGGSGSWDWVALREPCLRLLADLMSVDMRLLWPHGLPEEEAVGVVVKTAARVLANPGAMKAKPSRRATIELLALCVARFPSVGAAAVVALVEAVSKYEHAVGVAVELVELTSAGLAPGGGMAVDAAGEGGDVARGLPHGGRFFAPSVAAELLRDVGRITSGDAGGAKRASTFIIDVSERCPALVLANMAALLPHLDSDNATLRSALVTTLGNIVARSFNSATAEAMAKTAVAAAVASGGDPATAAAEAASLSTRTRDALLDALADRVYDVHSYTRAAALKAWSGLASTAAVPLDRFERITRVAADRLMDKGALVRKAAATLLRTVLEANPFGPRVDAGAFKAQFVTVNAWLKAHSPPAVYAQLAGEPAPAAAKKGGKKRGLVATAEDEEEDAATDALNEAVLADSAAAISAEEAGAPAPESGMVDVTISPEIATYLRYYGHLQAAITFSEAIASALPAAVQLLSSKTASDTREAIRFLSRARAFGVPGAEPSLARMLVLVWSDETGVREEVVDTFDALYLRNESLGDDGEEGGEGEGEEAKGSGAAKAAEAAPAARPKRSRAKAGSMAEDEDGEGDAEDEEDDEAPTKGKKGKPPAKSKAAKVAAVEAVAEAPASKPRKRRAPRAASSLDPAVVAGNLVSLLGGASLAVRTSLEEVLREAAKQGMLPPGLGDALWSLVGVGLEAVARVRIDVSSCLLGLRNLPPAEGTASVAAVGGVVVNAEEHLTIARSAMALLSMVGGTLTGALDDETAIVRLAYILRSSDGSPVPVGASFLRAAIRELGVITPPGSVPDLRFVDLAISVGDYRLARHACVALQRLRGYSVAQKERKAAEAPPAPALAKGKAVKAAAKAEAGEAGEVARAAQLAGLLGCVTAMVEGAWDGGDVECVHWYPAAQQGIDAIFALAPQPLALAGPMIQNMISGLLLGDGAAAAGGEPAAYLPTLSLSRLTRLFFAVGHVALRTLAHTEALASRAKILRIRAAEKADKDSAAAPGKGGAGGGKANAAKDGIEEQLGVSAAEDEKEGELTTLIAEHELCGANLCGLIAPLLRQVVTGHLGSAAKGMAEGSAADPLSESALLALCKFMAVSSSFCEANLQLIFTVLARSPCPALRGTITVALGDLAVRFPNLTEPYTAHMYARLRDGDAGVRKSALMVLTHLILAEQIKVKGNVGEIAVCLNDEDPRISDLTRMVRASSRWPPRPHPLTPHARPPAVLHGAVQA
jgi:hypothetical protein